MQLTFKLPHLSIASFPTIDVPPFTLITGVNGSGKTHLLRALEVGRIKANVAPSPDRDIRFFDWSSLVPKDTGEFQTAAIYGERDNLLQWAHQAREEQRDQLLQWKSQYGLSATYRGSNAELLRLTRPELAKLLAGPTQEEHAWEQLQNIATSALSRMKKQVRSNVHLLPKFSELSQRYGTGVVALDVKDFEDEPFGWGQVDIFQQSFAQLFLTYFEQKRLNMLRQMDEAAGRRPPAPAMSDEEFLEKHGEPPWLFINRILSEANLDFAIDYPVYHSTTKFTPQLRKLTSGAELRFSELSSGERILMSFAFCLYYSLDARQELRRPTLLLFDEIDAPLHPSMSRQMMDTIRNTLVKEQGVNVIMTTHSPSTVAVAPEDVVFVMRPNDAGLHKVGKHQAIATLTAEIPTLSIDFEGRRQVFVESQHDAQRYEKLFRYTSPLIASERSLAFIAVGKRKEQGDSGSGCDQVKRIVRQLVEFGNDSVFGLVDWDLKNHGDDRVIVLARNSRYAVENCLLDPLLVAALLIQTDRSWGEKIGLAAEKGYLDLVNLTPEERQSIVDNIERRVLPIGDETPFGDRVRVEYLGGFSAAVSRAYLTMPGHILEEKVKETLSPLKRYKNTGELLMKIIDPVIFDLSGLLPIEVRDAFLSILNCDTSRYQ